MIALLRLSTPAWLSSKRNDISDSDLRERLIIEPEEKITKLSEVYREESCNLPLWVILSFCISSLGEEVVQVQLLGRVGWKKQKTAISIGV